MTPVGWQVLTRNLNRLQTVTADKGMTGTISAKSFGVQTFDQ